MTMEVIMLTKNFWALRVIILILALSACSAPSIAEESNLDTKVVEQIQDPIAESAVAEKTFVEPTAVAAPLPETNEIIVETAVFSSVSTATLTDTEIEALQFMREEEKLARDVYLVLYEQWGVPIFQNIADSEQAHIDIVLSLMARYELADSTANLGPGEFANEALQALYDQLVMSGSQSLADALRVGALIEETDIADLENRLARIQNREISQAFNNLRQGSFNHLRSYANMLERQTGEVYQPQVLSAAAYADILASSPNGMGGQNQGQGNGGGNGNGNDNSNGNGNGNGNGRGKGGGNG
jgi:hypothetical protein